MATPKRMETLTGSPILKRSDLGLLKPMAKLMGSEKPKRWDLVRHWQKGKLKAMQTPKQMGMPTD